MPQRPSRDVVIKATVYCCTHKDELQGVALDVLTSRLQREIDSGLNPSAVKQAAQSAGIVLAQGRRRRTTGSGSRKDRIRNLALSVRDLLRYIEGDTPLPDNLDARLSSIINGTPYSDSDDDGEVAA